MDDYTEDDNIQVTVNEDLKSVKVHMFFDNGDDAWMEFDAKGVDDLIYVLLKARVALEDKTDD